MNLYDYSGCELGMVMRLFRGTLQPKPGVFGSARALDRFGTAVFAAAVLAADWFLTHGNFRMSSDGLANVCPTLIWYKYLV